MIVGNYRFGGCVIDGVRYAIIKNYDVVERIRVIQSDGNPLIWQKGDPLDERVLKIIAEANYTVPHACQHANLMYDRGR